MVVEGSGQFPDESLTVDNANRGSVRGEPSEGFDTAAGASRRGGLNQRCCFDTAAGSTQGGAV